ncbi:6291_t:CDS:2 [Ambispora leptoticha]|uniref:6291_t:CDS:1 n=1 Tax=Ambispora leptoticha TaxID=144679 RepID=A0A9N8W2T4_9GLOM|nr:6291_t:CDS:2 [Ambispora leptoticha]
MSLNLSVYLSMRDILDVIFINRFGRQLWSWDGGFLINKASRLALDYEEGYLRKFQRTYICQNARKPKNEANTQLWCLLKDGFIASAENQYKLVLYILGDSTTEGAHIILHRKKRRNNDSQRWIIIRIND